MVSDALTCAINVQRDLQQRDKELLEERQVRFRIGVNVGEVIVDRDDIYGEGVNIAARLEGLAEPGGVCVSEAVRNAVGLVENPQKAAKGKIPGNKIKTETHAGLVDRWVEGP